MGKKIIPTEFMTESRANKNILALLGANLSFSHLPLTKFVSVNLPFAIP